MLSTCVIIFTMFVFVFAILISSWAIVELLRMGKHNKTKKLSHSFLNGLIYLYLVFIVATSIIGISFLGFLVLFS